MIQASALSAGAASSETIDLLAGDSTHDNCAICLEPMDDIKKVLITPCGHRLHLGCVLDFEEHKARENVKQRTCPLCRKSFEKYEYAYLPPQDEDEDEDEEASSDMGARRL